MSNPNPTYKIPKGTTPNPNGRPKREWTMTGLLEEALEEQDETGTPYKKVITKKLRQLASKGDLTAIKEVNQRLDGMPTQKLDQKIEGNIEISFHNSLKQDETTTIHPPRQPNQNT